MLAIALIASNIAWALTLAFIVVRGLAAHQRSAALADARESAIRDNYNGHVRHLEDQIVLLKVEPQQAAVVALADAAPETYIPPFDDEALAEWESERAKVRVE